MSDTDSGAAWALPQLLRALWQGHPSHRARVLRLLSAQSDEALSREPVTGAFRRILRGGEVDQIKRIGELISSRGLTAYSGDLVDLLRGAQRDLAMRWLRRPRFPFPKAEVLRLVADEEADLQARREGLRLLGRRGALTRDELLGLLPSFAEPRLHGPLLALLEPHADEAMVSALAAANHAYGEALIRKRRRERGLPEEPGLLHRILFVGHAPSSLGELEPTRAAQRPFVHGIAHLAAAAGCESWLAALLPYLWDSAITQRLAHAYSELSVTRVAAPLLALHAPSGRALAIKIQLLGQLGATQAKSFIVKSLPPFGREASEPAKAAILALARLGERVKIGPYLAGALSAMRESLDQPPEGTPGHPSTWSVSFQAAAELGDPRFGQLGLALLSAEGLNRVLVELDVVFAQCLTRLDPLELAPTVERVLTREGGNAHAQRLALEVVERKGLRGQLRHLVALSCRVPTMSSLGAKTLRKMLRAEDGPLARSFFEGALPDDGTAGRLLDRCEEVLAKDDLLVVAQQILGRGVGGPKTQRAALRLLGSGDPAVLLARCVELLGSAHGKVASAALREALRLGVLAPQAAALHGHALLRLTRRALARAPEDPDAKAQLGLLLDHLVPKAGVPGQLEAEAAEELRARLYRVGLWTELPTFMSMHRELLDRTLAGHDLALFHGALLSLTGPKTFFHPISMKKGPYPGPLPRFDDTFASPSPFVQEGLWDVVCGPGYLRTQRLVLRFLGSPLPSVRAGALARLARETCLNYSEEVMARAGDDAAAVRRALVELLRKHELSRFAEELEPLLDDPDEGVRLLTTRVLGGWGDPACLSRLAAFLGSDDPKVRREAALAMAGYEPHQLAGHLAPFVSADRPLQAAAAMLALRPSLLPDDEALKAALFDLAARGRGPLRGLALRFLPALADPRRLGQVVPLLADAQPDVRKAAAWVLARRDGRRHAAAIAQLASETQDTTIRLEVLGLLAELGVAEATRGLLPLLLDDDPRVRRATAAAASATRGFSLQPELIAVLERGLEGAASPDGIRELVDLLHRTGDEDVFAAIAPALRCEDRPVWEAVIRAAKARDQDHHLPILAGLLKASPPLPARLLTLAISELERLAEGPRRDALPEAARALARSAGAQTLQRRALLAAFRVSGDEDVLAKELQGPALKKLKELEKSRQTKEKDTRREMAQLAGTATTCAWVLAARHRESTSELAKSLSALPGGAWGVWRGTLPWRFVTWSLELAAKEGAVPKALIAALAEVETNDHDRAKSRVATRLVRGLRDRVPPGDWLKLFDSLSPEETPDLARSRLAAQLLHEEASLDEHRRRLQKASDETFPLVRDTYLAAVEVVRPELRPLLADVIAELKRRKVDLQPKGWYARRQAEELWQRLVGIKLRLGVREGSDVLNELRPDGRQALMTAEGDVAGLARLLEKDGDESAYLLSLGEVGDAAAARELAKHVGHRKPEFRKRVAEALARCTGAARAARGGVRALLSDDEPSVVAAALGAVTALEDDVHTDAVLAGLAHERDDVVRPAVQAAVALKLRRALPILRTMLAGENPLHCKLALEAAAELADESMLGELLTLARQGVNAAGVDQAVRAILRALGDAPSSARLDQVGALLGEDDKMAPRIALRVIAAHRFQKAAPGVRAMIQHGSATVRGLACEAALALGDFQALEVLRERMKKKGTAAPSFRHLSAEVQVAGLRLFAGLAQNPEAQAELRGYCLDALADQRLAPHAALALAEVPLGEAERKAIRDAVRAQIKSGRSGDQAIQRGFQALRRACPDAVAKIARETAWGPVVSGRGGGAFQEDMLEALAEWLLSDDGAAEREGFVRRALEQVDFDRARERSNPRTENLLLRFLWRLAPALAAPWIRRQLERAADADLLTLYAELLESEHAQPEYFARLRSGLVHSDARTRQRVRAILRGVAAPPATGSLYEEALARAKANDPQARALVGLLVNGPWGRAFAGDLLVALHRVDTDAARDAVRAQLGAVRPETWPGFKRIFKLNERELDAELFAQQAWVLDQDSRWSNPSLRTCQYMQRRSFRQLKGVGLEHPERFFEFVGALLSRFAAPTRRGSVLLPRLLRAAPESAAEAQRFEVKLENPFAAKDDEHSARVPDLIESNAEELLAPPPAPPPAVPPEEPKRTVAWRGPIFSELWTREPTRLVELLGGEGHSAHVQQVALGLLREQVGERILEVPLESFYGLLRHPSRHVFSFALGQVAARARRELIRFGELVLVFERLVKEPTTDWDALADVLWVLDDERAGPERAGLAAPLRDLLIKQSGAAGIGPVVTFFRSHFGAQLGAPLFDWSHALSLAQARRPDVRELARDIVRALAKTTRLGAPQVPQLLEATPLLEDAPDLVHEVLTASAAKPEGYRPVLERDSQGADWTVAECVAAALSLGELGAIALRRALLWFEEQGGLPPALGWQLIGGGASTRRSRALGMELLGAALDRGAVAILDLTETLTEAYPEDVVTWAGGRLRAAAQAGGLPNEALYRLLDATRENVNEYARELVREHLQRFEVAELVVFCAESPDAATSDLGIRLYEGELKDHGYDLRQLLPMFRILLFKVARARKEKTALLGTLRRWALEAPENAALVIDVLAAFRRSEAKIDFSEAMLLLATIGERFPGAVDLPFETSTSFGHVVGAV